MPYKIRRTCEKSQTADITPRHNRGIATHQGNEMSDRIITDSQIKFYFQVTAERFNRARAVRMTAARYGVTQAAVKRAAYYWN
jgi:hypothetical protein